MDRFRGLYVIVDPEHCGGRAPIEIATAALRGGARVLQLRAKGLGDRERLALARALQARCAERSIPFVMNDRPDLAVLAGADAVHLGQDDLPIADVRKIVGPMPIGMSTHDIDQARRAIADGADMIGFGPVFATRTKTNAEPVVGLDRLRRACETANVPVIAIGGVAIANVAGVASAGATMWAVISAIGEAPDPEAAARALTR